MYHVVIIDDEKEISSGFAQFFPWKELGFTVEASFSGAREAMEYLLSHLVDVVVSDVIMPDMSGIELARAIYEANLPQKPLVVLFSAYEKFEYAREAMHYHCADYMLKGMSFEELKEAFSKLRKRLDEERGATEAAVVEDHIIQAMQHYVAKDPVCAPPIYGLGKCARSLLQRGAERGGLPNCPRRNYSNCQRFRISSWT